MDYMHKEEWFLSPFQNGFKILALKNSGICSLKELFSHDFPAFLVNSNYQMASLNSVTASSCGFDSESAAVGKTIFDFCEREKAEAIFQADKMAIVSQKRSISEDTIILEDGTIHNFLGFRVPLYNEKNKNIGLLGCSIDLDNGSLASSLTKMTALGLLNASSVNIPSKLSQVYLSKQQRECAKLLLKGFSSKQIAKGLNLSYRTVEAYVNHLKNKLSCQNKTELVLKLQALLGAQGFF